MAAHLERADRLGIILVGVDSEGTGKQDQQDLRVDGGKAGGARADAASQDIVYVVAREPAGVEVLQQGPHDGPEDETDLFSIEGGETRRRLLEGDGVPRPGSRERLSRGRCYRPRSGRKPLPGRSHPWRDRQAFIAEH
jgi:hypothetical protein